MAAFAGTSALAQDSVPEATIPGSNGWVAILQVEGGQPAFYTGTPLVIVFTFWTAAAPVQAHLFEEGEDERGHAPQIPTLKTG